MLGKVEEWEHQILYESIEKRVNAEFDKLRSEISTAIRKTIDECFIPREAILFPQSLVKNLATKATRAVNTIYMNFSRWANDNINAELNARAKDLSITTNESDLESFLVIPDEILLIDFELVNHLVFREMEILGTILSITAIIFILATVVCKLPL